MKYDIRNLPYDKVTVSPSILAADFGTLDADVAKAAAAGALSNKYEEYLEETKEKWMKELADKLLN